MSGGGDFGRPTPRVRGAVLLLAVLPLAWFAYRYATERNGPALVDLVGDTMGTSWRVRAVASTAESASLRAVIQTSLDAVDQRFSTYRTDSVISTFNALRSTEPFAAGPEFVDVLRIALSIAAATDGAYDPTVFPVVRLWGFAGGERAEPSDAELTAARAAVGFDKLEIIGPGSLRKTDPRVELDLSSIAKGWGVDRVSEALLARGVRAHMIEVGGEVVCRGTHPDGTPWRIGVERPDPVPESFDTSSESRPIQQVVELRDRALATSGSYRNWFAAGGNRPHHILDARTGRNVPSAVVSVSVTAADCALADGLATALMLVGPEAAEAVLAAVGGADVRALFLLSSDEPGVVRAIEIGGPLQGPR